MSERFVFFKNFKSIADKLPDDMRLKFYDALLAYVFDGIEPDDMVIAALIIAIKPSLDKEETRGGVREGAGAPKGNQNAIKNNQTDSKTIKNNQTEITNNQNNQSFLETGNRKEETKEKDTLKCVQKEKVKNFVKPTVDEIDAYCRESQHYIDVGRFYDFYECKGWKVGKNPMKDWRAAVRNWYRSEVTAPACRKVAESIVNDNKNWWEQ